MRDCGFPVIPEYLAEQSWPDARLSGALVTHVWTQSPVLSSHIAKASLVPNVVASPEDMIGHIDAVLLARDDAESHLKLAQPFLDAGLPIYIDKPIAQTLDELDMLYSLQQYTGQIFTCSALRYAAEFQLSEQARARIGAIRHIEACTPKSWAKYAPHIIEPVLQLIGLDKKLVSLEAKAVGRNGRRVVAEFDGNITASLSALGDDTAGPIALRIHGEAGWQDMFFADAFPAFKAALQDFIDGICTGSCRSTRDFNTRVVTLIEAGLAE